MTFNWNSIPWGTIASITTTMLAAYITYRQHNPSASLLQSIDAIVNDIQVPAVLPIPPVPASNISGSVTNG